MSSNEMLYILIDKYIIFEHKKPITTKNNDNDKNITRYIKHPKSYYISIYHRGIINKNRYKWYRMTQVYDADSYDYMNQIQLS